VVTLTIRPAGIVHGDITMSLSCTPTFDALRFVADQLGVSVCHYHRGAFHFALGRPGATVAIRPDSAGRFCVMACQYAVACDKKWVSSTDRARLARLVTEATEVMMDDARPRAPHLA
jgi:hypothetical protein